MDVTEVDATTSFTGTVAGGIANIGARAGTSGGTLAGQTGSVAGGVTYSESPLIRYQPLLGQPLVAQLATPVGPDALASLYDSSWGVMPLLDLATSFLTLDQDEFYAALNIIAELDSGQGCGISGRKIRRDQGEKFDCDRDPKAKQGGKHYAGSDQQGQWHRCE